MTAYYYITLIIIYYYITPYYQTANFHRNCWYCFIFFSLKIFDKQICPSQNVVAADNDFNLVKSTKTMSHSSL